MSIHCVIADYENIAHKTAIQALMDHYAKDPAGGGEAIASSCLAQLPQALAQFPGALTIIAYEDKRAIGLLNAFPGFSTFKCRPLLNIHDIVVHEDFRRRGVCREMLLTLEEQARARRCCKITLEVLSGNDRAKAVYQNFGFSGYELEPSMGQAIFWQKNL